MFAHFAYLFFYCLQRAKKVTNSMKQRKQNITQKSGKIPATQYLLIIANLQANLVISRMSTVFFFQKRFLGIFTLQPIFCQLAGIQSKSNQLVHSLIGYNGIIPACIRLDSCIIALMKRNAP